MKRILISAGDYSGDLHGESLVKSLRKTLPDLEVTALGGIRLKSVAQKFLRDMVGLDISGFTKPIKQYFNLKSFLLKTVFPILEKKEADAVICIDYYGFNIHIAHKAKKEGIPVYYFVSPQVWASRRWRIQRLKESVTKMIVIFPFEEKLYKEHGIPVEFVGHPIMELIERVGKSVQHKKNEGGSVRMGLMPGSRAKEISRHLPLMIRSYESLKKKFNNLEGILFAVDAIEDSLYKKYLKGTDIKFVRSGGYEERLSLDFCLTASGTATLENALFGIPMIVMYRMSWLTYLIARAIIKVPYITMANILSGKEVVPELVQYKANLSTIVRLASGYITDPNLLERTRSELIKLRNMLGLPGAYDRAAAAILKDL